MNRLLNCFPTYVGFDLEIGLDTRHVEVIQFASATAIVVVHVGLFQSKFCIFLYCLCFKFEYILLDAYQQRRLPPSIVALLENWWIEKVGVGIRGE